MIAHAFGSLDFTSLVAFTAAWNTRSRRVMEKIGMIRDPEDDFLHPALPGDHKLAPHVLYRITAEAYEQARAGPALVGDLDRHETQIAILVGEQQERRLPSGLLEIVDALRHVVGVATLSCDISMITSPA